MAMGNECSSNSGDIIVHNDTKKKGADKDSLQSISDKFSLCLPKDFLDFWRFCEFLKPNDPATALLSALGLLLVGPYDILSGNFPDDVDNGYLHWRFYYDPPEFVTTLAEASTDKAGKRIVGMSGFHIGYFR